MAESFAVRADVSEKLREEYAKKLVGMSVEELVAEFFSYLDWTEESDSGRVFRPITIGSCRVLMTQPLEMCMAELRHKAGVKPYEEVRQNDEE